MLRAQNNHFLRERIRVKKINKQATSEISRSNIAMFAVRHELLPTPDSDMQESSQSFGSPERLHMERLHTKTHWRAVSKSPQVITVNSEENLHPAIFSLIQSH